MMRSRVWDVASGFQIGKDVAYLLPRGRAAGTFSALFSIDPLKEDV
jgi:hypothetical protein